MTPLSSSPVDVSLVASPREVRELVRRERKRASRRSDSLYDEDGIDGPWERAMAEPFCACGRVVSRCDHSRAGCARRAGRSS